MLCDPRDSCMPKYIRYLGREVNNPVKNLDHFCLQPKAKDLGIIWVVLVLGFFVWSMLYQLSPPCYPQSLKISYNIIPTVSIYQSINHSIYLSIDTLLPQTREPVSALFISNSNFIRKHSASEQVLSRDISFCNFTVSLNSFFKYPKTLLCPHALFCLLQKCLAEE